MKIIILVLRIMKNGVKGKNKTLENIIIATVYFLIFSLIAAGIGAESKVVFTNPTISNIILYILAIIAMLIFLILFLSAWEDIFESEGHPYG